jgi:flavin-dependent dehydrogenase
MNTNGQNSDAAHFDAIVIGAGPAGSTAAAVLAEKGRRVVILEKQKFPRYSVGESLIPYCYFPLERIGVLEKIRQAAFVKKYSVQFAGVDGRISQPFYFFQHLEHEASQTWQVWRSEFDKILLDNALEKGAQVLEETVAKKLIRDGDQYVGVEARGKDGVSRSLYAPITIDCSGRDGFALKRNDWLVRDPKLNKISIWTYYRGGLRDKGHDEGATTVAYLPEKGWFWYLPLAGDVVSVGITAEADYLYRGGKDVPAIFEREIHVNKWIEEHLVPAERINDFRVTGEYSYRSRHCAAGGLVLAGDAFAFLDPVFSSGVLLALRGGEMAGDAVDAALTAGDFSAERFRGYSEQLCSGMEAMRKLVYAFYDDAFSFGKLFRKYPDLRSDTTDCLIGNLFRDFDPLFKAVAEFADVPKPVPHGAPLTTASKEMTEDKAAPA